MKCLNCGLINPESALRCDCGYDFKENKVKKSYDKSFQKNNQGWCNFFLSFYKNARKDTLGKISIRIFTFLTLVLIFGSLIGSRVPGGHPPLGGIIIIGSIFITFLFSPIGALFGMAGLIVTNKKKIDNRFSILGIVLNLLLFGLVLTLIILEKRVR